MKYLTIETTVTGDMYGFSNIALALTEENLNELRRLRDVITQVKAIDNNIYNVTLYTHNLDIELFNDGFDLDIYNEEKKLDEDNIIIDLNQEELEVFNDENGDFRIDGDLIRVSEYGITVSYLSKWTSDEVWCEFNFEAFEKFFEKSLVV